MVSESESARAELIILEPAVLSLLASVTLFATIIIGLERN